THPVTIEGLGARGEGVAHDDGRTLFLPWTVPGDVVALSGDGRMEALETPSPDRVAPVCDYFTRCGGCATQTVALPVQWRWKRDLVVAALT
ncbi:TRAM domain-containing protein, partial [Enterobacter sp. PTB]|uniref:TRAM domain-containing protein n=1 Tax=Enterobacter sp. PTB TaxID=3143437 RepID=UPI003DAA0F80